MTGLDSYLASFDVDRGYLDWASFGPLSPSVRAESHADAELLGSGRPGGIGLVAQRAGEASGLLAELTGIPAEQVTVQPSTTAGLMQAMWGLAGEVLVSPLEFPALTVTAHRAAAQRPLTVRPLETADGFVTADAVADALTDDITAVALSAVDYRTGYRADLPAIRDAIGDRLLIVDAIQAFGVVDEDWTVADVVCGQGYKWLRAGRSTGYAAFSERALDRLEPVLSGPAGRIEPLGPPEAALARGAAAFTVSTADTVAAARLATALRELRDARVADVAALVSAHARVVFTIADRYGIPVLTPREEGRHAGIVALDPGAGAGVLAAELSNHGVTVTARDGLVRIAVHAGTGAETLALLDEALAAYAASRDVRGI